MATTIPNRTPLIVSPHLYLGDVTGRPLDYGMVFFGEPNKDPEFYPIKVFSDKELKNELAQPVRTKGGFLNQFGDLVEVFAYEGVYSVKVLDQYGRKIFYKAEVAKQTIEDATSDVVDAAQVEINRRMFLLDGAIATALAAGAGKNGWTTALIEEDGLTQKQINEKQKKKNAQHITVEDFGASADATPQQNATAIKNAILALKDGQKLYQATPVLSVTQIDATRSSDIFNAEINLNLSYAGASGDYQAIKITNVKKSLINISVNCNDINATCLRLDNCDSSTLPKTAVLKNAKGTTTMVCGVFARDCDDMQYFCTIENIGTDGSQIVRGIFITDIANKKNTSLVAPTIKNLYCPEGASVWDTDGVYASDNTDPSHKGGIRFIGGKYENCCKRFIKCMMARPLIIGNTGINSGIGQNMYSFVSVYANDSGIVGDNDFIADKCLYGIEYGADGFLDITAQIGINRLRTKDTASASSYAYRFWGKLVNVNMAIGECVGFSGLISQVNITYVTSATGQIIIASRGTFDTLNTPTPKTCISLSGDYSTADFSKITCAQPTIASLYFLSAPNITKNIVNMRDVKHGYSWGSLLGNRPKNIQDGSTIEYKDGVKIEKRLSTPTSGNYEVGDKIINTNFAIGQAISWTCTVAGNPGTWVADGFYGVVTDIATNMQAATKAINVSNKYLGKQVINTTDNKLYYATGSAATDVWRSVDGATTITPA